ncbi:hypothetical protein QBC39DRAFT_332164 [Podospora conica]|nr:hypothetical protein QBC39DRAFT_332164 [Schizothecium conicum]
MPDWRGTNVGANELYVLRLVLGTTQTGFIHRGNEGLRSTAPFWQVHNAIISPVGLGPFSPTARQDRRRLTPGIGVIFGSTSPDPAPTGRNLPVPAVSLRQHYLDEKKAKGFNFNSPFNFGFFHHHAFIHTASPGVKPPCPRAPSMAHQKHVLYAPTDASFLGLKARNLRISPTDDKLQNWTGIRRVGPPSPGLVCGADPAIRTPIRCDPRPV